MLGSIILILLILAGLSGGLIALFVGRRFYHFITHYGRWPQPRGYMPEHPLDPPAQFDVDNRWLVLPITHEQEQKKLDAIKVHKTQWGSGQAYLESLVRTNELFDVIDEIPVLPGEAV